jgi:hypothetical protein
VRPVNKRGIATLILDDKPGIAWANSESGVFSGTRTLNFLRSYISAKGELRVWRLFGNQDPEFPQKLYLCEA